MRAEQFFRRAGDPHLAVGQYDQVGGDALELGEHVRGEQHGDAVLLRRLGHRREEVIPGHRVEGGQGLVAMGLTLDAAATEGPIGRLSPREREVLELMAEGRSNAAIASRLFVTERAVAKHTASIFAKLDLQPSDDDNRRVLAVLAYLGR